MTDKARELLERLLKNFEKPVAGRFGDLFDEVRTYLAEPEVKREPIGQGDYVLGEGSEYFDPAPRPEPEPEQEQERLDLIGELHPNGLVDFVNDEIPIHHVFPVKLYAKGEALINEIAKCNSDILLGKDHPARRPEFVKLSEEEVSEILSSAHTPYEAICAAENMLVRKNTSNKSNPDSIDLQSRCRGDKL